MPGSLQRMVRHSIHGTSHRAMSQQVEATANMHESQKPRNHRRQTRSLTTIPGMERSKRNAATYVWKSCCCQIENCGTPERNRSGLRRRAILTNSSTANAPQIAALSQQTTAAATNAMLNAFMPNDPSSATRPVKGVDCNHSAMAGFAAAHG